MMNVAEYNGLINGVARLDITIRKNSEHVECKRAYLINTIGLNAVAVSLDHHILCHLNTIIGGQHVLDVHPIGTVAKKAIKLLLFPLIQGNIHHLEEEIGSFLMCIKIANVFDKFIKIYLCPTDILIFF